MKNILNYLFPRKNITNDSFSLKKKWMKNELVKEWEKKGWLNEENNILNYMLSEWEKHKKPVPPPHNVKQSVIWEYQKKYSHDVFIETGTYLGRMIDAQKEFFKKIYSIEIDKTLFENVVEKYAKHTHIKIYLGDSAYVLKDVMSEIKEPAIFWLDAHYHRNNIKGAKECPIFEELETIFLSKFDHIILIDDARLFVGKNGYPTLKELSKYIKIINNQYKMEINHDIIHLKK